MLANEAAIEAQKYSTHSLRRVGSGGERGIELEPSLIGMLIQNSYDVRFAGAELEPDAGNLKLLAHARYRCDGTLLRLGVSLAFARRNLIAERRSLNFRRGILRRVS
jgi:hypothetical protein